MCALPDDYDGLVGVARAAAQPETSPLPFELIEGNEHHGPYIVNAYGGTVCDFYTMSNPSALSVRNGGDSRPVPFTCADGNAAFMVRAANCHDELVAALREMCDRVGPRWFLEQGWAAPLDAIARAEARP